MVAQSFKRLVARALCSLTCVGSMTPAVAQVDENALKAAFIYNFAMFTSWKAHPVEGPAFNVCVDRESPLKTALAELSGKSVDARAWTVRTMPPMANASLCQIVVYQEEEGGLSPELAAAVYGNSVLLVTDGGVAENNQAVITLVLEGDHLRFDVDLEAAQDRGVTLSSKLLRLARNVL